MIISLSLSSSAIAASDGEILVKLDVSCDFSNTRRLLESRLHDRCGELAHRGLHLYVLRVRPGDTQALDGFRQLFVRYHYESPESFRTCACRHEVWFATTLSKFTVQVYNIFGQLDSSIFSDVLSCPKQSHEAEDGAHEEPRERPDELSQPAGRSHHGIFSKA